MSARSLRQGLCSRPSVRVRDGAAWSQEDALVVEEPLEIRLCGETFTTTMRTPGRDRELALGLLFSEGVVRSAADVGAVRHCGRANHPDHGHTLDVLPGAGTQFDDEAVERARRTGVVTAACGVCGRAQIEALLQRVTPVPRGPALSPKLLHALPDLLASGQENFARTGGLHAAVALDEDGEVLALEEDIGRHNAVDKVIGRLLLQGHLNADERRPPVLLGVSGRSGFEIAHKAVSAGFRALASVSAASSLAVDLAQRSGLSLAAFVRDGRFNLYAGAERFGLPNG